MCDERFSRARILLGRRGLEILAGSRVAVFGLGGVGGYTVEALARAGIGALDLIDNDVFSLSNLNRQILATTETVGRKKTDVAAARVRSINPACRVNTYGLFFLPETKDAFDFSRFDYVADAIDTVAGKLQLIECANAAGTPIVSCMGTGNKLDPTRLRVSDIYETSGDPLARVMRRECRKRGVPALKTVWSDEPPLAPAPDAFPENRPVSGRPAPGSVSFVPSAAGLLLAAEIVRDLLRLHGHTPGAAEYTVEKTDRIEEGS